MVKARDPNPMTCHHYPSDLDLWPWVREENLSVLGKGLNHRHTLLEDPTGTAGSRNAMGLATGMADTQAPPPTCHSVLCEMSCQSAAGKSATRRLSPQK